MLYSAVCFGQLTANFSSVPVSGCAPLTVHFQDLSTGGPTSWQWDLGNTTLSSQQSPATTYFNAGTYTVSLKVSNASGSDSITKLQYITVYDKPVANFSASTLTGCFPLNEHFTDMSSSSSGSITNWSWDFGNGDTSSLQNPNYTYITAGDYSITLKVTDNNGCSKVFSQPQYINIPNGITANFSNSSPTHCKPPDVVNFQNLSTGPATLSYQWSFGDGNTSTAANPSNTYLTGGVYSVQLITKSSVGGCVDTLLEQNSIVITNFQGGLSGPNTICTNVAANFNDISVPADISSFWSFGDGTNSTLSNPTKVWTAPATYQVMLVSNYGSCLDTNIKSVIVLAPANPNFTANDSINCKAPFSVQFQDLTVGGKTWAWSFGDGFTSTSQNPSHTYTTSGQFSVTLTVTNAAGCGNTVTKNQYIKIVNPTVVMDSVPAGGCLPFTFKPTSNVSDPKGVASYLWVFGDGNTSTSIAPTNIYSSAGTYTVRLSVTTNDGCIDSAKGVVKTGLPSTADFSATPLTQCAGQNIQFTDLTTPSDSSWLWSFGDGGASAKQNPLYAYQDSGAFTVKLIAYNNGCPDTIIKKKYIYITPPVAKFTPVFNCTAKTNVQFNDNSIQPKSWLWDFGDGNTSASQNPVNNYAILGNYTVTLVVKNGACTDTSKIPIQLIDEHPTTTLSQDTICKNSNVTVAIASVNTANIGEYGYSYGDGSVTAYGFGKSSLYSYKTAGTYKVYMIAVDLHVCRDTTPVQTLYVHGPTANFSAAPLIGCKGLNVIFTDNSTASGTNPITTWQLSYGDGVVQNFAGPPFSHIYTAVGNYFPLLKVTDSGGCFDTITSNAPIQVVMPTADFNTNDPQVCIGGNVVFNDLSAGTNLTYSWTLGNGVSSTQQNPVTSYFIDSNYSIKLIVTDAYGCQDSTQKNNYIQVKTVKASYSINDSVSSCGPFEVDFTNTSVNSTSQTWDFGDGSSSIAKNPVHYYSIPGIYIATLYALRQEGDCVDSFKRTIHLFPSDAKLTYSPLAACSQITVNFHVSASIPVTYFWDFGNGNTLASTDSNVVNTYVLPGNFVPKVILTDSIGCLIPLTGTDTIHLTKSDVNFNVLNSSVCSGTNNMFIDSTISNATVISWQWNFGDGSTASIETPAHSYALSGTYPVQLIVNTINGCADSLTKNIPINLYYNPKADITGDTSSCVPAALTFAGIILNPDTSSLIWQWHFGNGNTSNVQTPAIQSYNTVGNFPLQLIVSTLNGCSDTVNKTILIYPLPTTNAGNYTNVCVDAPLQLIATGASTYVWSPATYLNCTACNSPVSVPADTITYYVTGTTINGCQTTDSVFLDVHKRFILTVTPTTDSLCTGQSVQLTAGGADNYVWSPAAGLSNDQINNPLATPVNSTIYKVVGYDNANCFRDTSTVAITVFPYPTVIAGPNINIPDGGSVTLSPQYSANIATWLWDPPAGLSCTTCATPIASPDKSTSYTITAANSIGCTSSDVVRINLPCLGSIFIPNTFSPNNDGVNDVFYPRGKNLYLIQSLRVFDRWGEMVFQRQNFTPNDPSQGWDGTYDGKQATPDVYVYIIEIICDNSNTSTFKGNVTLIR